MTVKGEYLHKNPEAGHYLFARQLCSLEGSDRVLGVCTCTHSTRAGLFIAITAL